MDDWAALWRDKTYRLVHNGIVTVIRDQVDDFL